MAIIKPTIRSAPSVNNQGGGRTVLLGTLAAAVTANTTKTDHVDLMGYISKAVIICRNGLTNSVVFGIEGCFDTDLDSWQAVQFREKPSDSYASADKTVTAGSKAYLYLSPIDTPRLIRVSVTTANALGSRFDVYAER